MITLKIDHRDAQQALQGSEILARPWARKPIPGPQLFVQIRACLGIPGRECTGQLVKAAVDQGLLKARLVFLCELWVLLGA